MTENLYDKYGLPTRNTSYNKINPPEFPQSLYRYQNIRFHFHPQFYRELYRNQPYN